MPIDPMTGQMIPYGAGAQDMPLAMRMLEDSPGMLALAGFGANRGSNTILRGGFMDDSKIFANRRADRYRVFSSNSLSPVSANQYVGSSARRSRMAAQGRQNFARSSRVNNFTMRPRAFSRFHSLSVFGPVGIGAKGTTGAYTPFMGSQLLGKVPGVASFTGASGEGAFGPGLLSFVTAGTKADRIERRALAGSARARRRLSSIDQNITRLAGMNNQAIMSTPSAVQRARIRPGTSTLTAQQRLASARSSVALGSVYDRGMAGAVSARMGASAVGTSAGGTVGVRGNLLASSMAGPGTRYMAGYFRGAMGYADVAGLEGKALEGAQRAVSQFTEALGGRGRVANKALEQGLFKTLGAKNVGKALMTRQGAAVIGARTIGMAIPGLNVLATASLAYDLGKMGGEIVKSGINLARDAAKSVQGSIYKPLFGMGYVDTEAAATSRSRGVMAIQNSRLNARSVLGSEAGMMAARYG